MTANTDPRGYGPLVYILDLPEATPSNNVLRSMHFRAYLKLRITWQFMVAGAIKIESNREPTVGPLARSYLHITRYSSGGGLDWDNAYGGLKPLLDCLVCPSDRNPDGLSLIQDDSPEFMPLPPAFVQLHAKPGHGRTVVRIYDASPRSFAIT